MPPAVGALNLNHWATKEVPTVHFKGSGASTLLPAALQGLKVGQRETVSSSHLSVAPLRPC